LKGSTETGSIVRITGSWRYLTFSQTYSEKGRVKVFFILASKAEPVFSRFLRERVAGMSLASPKDRFLLGSFLPGNEEVILPPFGNSYWGTQAGRKMRQIMIRSSNFRAPILLERPDHLLVVRGCPNLGDFVVGREISLADLNGQVRWQWLVLIMGVLLLAGIALLLGQATIAFLIEPMTAVERGLRELIHGRQPPPLALPRQDELGEVTRSFDSMVTGLGRRVKLGLFVSGSLEESLELGVDGALAGECSPARGVVLASDLRNFTTISETHSPEVVVDMLNQHLEAMSEAIKRHGGRIDKFIGDAIIAVFTGNPGDDPAARAVAAGLEMRRGHEALQAERRAHGLFTYEMGVGIDGGDLFVGTIGTHGRSEFTVFGPPREAAEALESASKKGTGTRVMISARIRDEAGTRFRCTAHGAGVFEVIGPAGQEGGDL